MTLDPRGDIDYRRPIEDRQNIPEIPEMPELDIETVLETGDWSSDPASVGVVLLTFIAVGAIAGVLIAAV